MASGSDDYSSKIWALNGKLKGLSKTLKGHKGIVYCLVELNEEMLASGSWDFTIRIRKIDSGNLVRELKGNCFDASSCYRLV